MPQPTTWIRLFLLTALALPAIGCDDDLDRPPLPTATLSPTGTTTLPSVATPTRTNTRIPPAPSATPSHTMTPPATASATTQLTATATMTATATSMATDTPTEQPTETPSEVPTATPTITASPTATAPDAFCEDGEILADDTCTAAGAEVGYRLDVTLPANPFPDDRYRDPDGRLAPPVWSFSEIGDPNAVNPGSATAFTNNLLAAIREHATGWGNYSPIELRLSTEIDTATIANGVHLLRRDGESWSEQLVSFTPSWYPGLRLLDLHPAVPLDAATTYAVVVSSEVETASGAPLGRTADFRRVLRGEADAAVQSALDYVEAELGVSRNEVAIAFTFTTQETWQDLVTIRERLDSNELAPPAISFADDPNTDYQEGIFTEGPIKQQLLGEFADDYRLAAIGTAHLYDFRGRNSIFDPAVIDGAAAPRTIAVRVQITVPNQPVPEEGFGVLFLGHGLGQSADFVWEIARGSAAIDMILPLMLVAADFPNHGERGTGNDIPDLLQYFHLNNFFAMRDSFRQTAAELIEVRRLIETASEGPFELINQDRILFGGASLGGINGATFLGVDSRVRTALLSVPAGELVRILEGEEVGQQIAPFIAAAVGLTPTHPSYPDFFRMLINRGLWIMGAGDPISYAPFVTGPVQLPGGVPKAVLIQEGIGDGVLPNATTESLARVMGVSVVTGEVRCDEPGCGVSGLWQFDLADYGITGQEPHQVSAFLPEAQEQLFTYLATGGQVITDASPR
ncbi:MAG TPA: hypothetical protein VEB21_05720 [Terriglobales bacterium]|nr:hypothetical protein [Terriglobales bacterium]